MQQLQLPEVLNTQEKKILKAYISTNWGTDYDIAAASGYTLNTVKNQMKLIRARLGCDNRTQVMGAILAYNRDTRKGA